VQVVASPASSVASGQTIAPREPAPLNAVSSIATPVRVTLPVLVARKE